MRLSIQRPSCVLALAALLAGAGCGQDDCATCSGDEGSGPTPTLENVWPHEDGNGWTYHLTSTLRPWTDAGAWIHEDPDSVPPMPSLEELHARLQTDLERSPQDSAWGVLHQEFDGMVTVLSNVTAQRLLSSVSVPEVLDTGAETARSARAVSVPTKPLFMTGYAWAMTPTRIVGYGDLSEEPNWIYLERDLSPGHGFSYPLPTLTSDIVLWGRVWQQAEWWTEAGTFQACIECFYAIDRVVRIRDPEGNVRYRRPLRFGSVVYAPGVGPVYCKERNLFFPPPGEGDPGIEEITAALVGSSRGSAGK